MSNVHHPSHYGGEDDPYETIKVMRAKLLPQEYAGALKFLVAKYNDRHRMKNGLEDLEKGLFYQAELVRFAREIGHDVIWPKPAQTHETILTRLYVDGTEEEVRA